MPEKMIDNNYTYCKKIRLNNIAEFFRNTPIFEELLKREYLAKCFMENIDNIKAVTILESIKICDEKIKLYFMIR